jgi:hypothetical protein
MDPAVLLLGHWSRGNKSFRAWVRPVELRCGWGVQAARSVHKAIEASMQSEQRRLAGERTKCFYQRILWYNKLTREP